MTQVKLIIYGVILLAILAGVGAIYAKGRIDASHKAEIAQLKDQLATSQLALTHFRDQSIRYNQIIKDHNERAFIDAARLSAIQREKEVILNGIESRNACLGPGDTQRLRDFFLRSGAASGVPSAAGDPG